jgi:hypothetical protein
LTVVICPGQIYSTDKDAKIYGDYWYEVTFQNQKIGYVHNTIEQTKYNGNDCYKFSEETLIKSKRDDGVVNENKTVSVSYTNLDYSPIYSIKEEQNGEQKQVNEIIVSGKQIIIKTTLNKDKAKEVKIDYEKGIVFDADGFLLKQKGLLKTGTSVSFKAISTETNSLKTQTFKVLKEEKITVLNKEINSCLLQSTDSDMPGLVAMIHLDPSDGSEIKMEMAGMVFNRATEEMAKEFQEIGAFSSYITTNVNIPFTSRIAQLQLIVTLNAASRDIISDNEYQTATTEGNSYKVVLKSIPATLKSGPKIPIENPSLKPYLKPSVFIQSDDPIIVKQAKEIIKEEKDGLKAVRLIAEWVFQNIIKQNDITSYKSAKEALQDKSGDCTEHAALFCALTRSAGIPTRNISGLIFDGAQFGYHEWNEVYLDKWVPVDATFNRIGIPATYIKLGEYEEGAKTSRQESLSRLIKMFGKTSIKVVSFKDKNNTVFDLSDLDKYIVKQGNSYEDKLMGITIVLPAKWGPEWQFHKRANGMIHFQNLSTSVILQALPLEEQKLTQKVGADFFAGIISGAHLEDIIQSPIQEITVSGCSGFESTFSGTSQSIKIKMRAIIVNGNQKAFIINFSSVPEKFNELSGDFEQLLQSIKF